MVVEDNPDNLYAITNILDETEYKYITAEDGKKAVSMAKEFHLDLILMDMQLPEVSGLEAAKQIQSDPELAKIPVIALTAKAMKGDREEILAAGLNDYISKPINPDNLIKLIHKWIG